MLSEEQCYSGRVLKKNTECSFLMWIVEMVQKKGQALMEVFNFPDISEQFILVKAENLAHSYIF